MQYALTHGGVHLLVQINPQKGYLLTLNNLVNRRFTDDTLGKCLPYQPDGSLLVYHGYNG